MKRDGRSLSHETLEEMRIIAVQCMAEGGHPEEVASSFGMHRTWVYKIRAQARGRGRGVRALRSSKGTGRPRKLTASQERQVFRWINGKNPMQYGLEPGLWSRGVVRERIQREFDVSLSLASVGALLSRLGLIPQKPLQRAYQRDPEAIDRWQRETYPALARQAREEKADIYFWDESGFQADAVHGKTWGVKGETPVVSVPGQRQSIRAASVVSAKGAFWFAIYAGALDGELFVSLLKSNYNALLKEVTVGLPVFLTKNGVGKYMLIDIADYEGALAAEMSVLDPAHNAETRARLLETIRHASKVDEIVPWTREELYDR